MPLTSPLRGGIHPIYGLFMGGSELDDSYALINNSPYKLTTQLRNSKQSSQSERSLMTARSNASAITFHGNLETPSKCITEYDKEGFVTALKEQVTYYGLQSFVSIRDANNKMNPLVENAHMFN